MNVLHIESRPSRRRKSEFEILVDVECDNKKMEQLTGLLKREVAAINLATYESGTDVPPATPMSATTSFGKCAYAVYYFFTRLISFFFFFFKYIVRIYRYKFYFQIIIYVFICI